MVWWYNQYVNAKQTPKTKRLLYVISRRSYVGFITNIL